MDLPHPLSGSVKGSFAYLTIKDRLPVIVTKVIDYLYRERETIKQEYGEAALDSCKEVNGRLSRLKNEMQTDKPLVTFITTPALPFDDTELWNRALEKYVTEHNEAPRWYTAPWLLVECYMYRAIRQAVILSEPLRKYDPFQVQKHQALVSSYTAAEALATYIIRKLSSLQSYSQESIKEAVTQLVEVSLWGNRCDLSISAGEEREQHGNLLELLESLRSFILVNDFENLWRLLTSLPEDQRDIAIVLDNAGFELVCDLCLLTLLCEVGLATNVHIYVKTYPWFVSDTTKEDFQWTLTSVRQAGNYSNRLADLWNKNLSEGRWKLRENKFWTLPHDFASMERADPSLYCELSRTALIIFKGDLNYRKLVGDLDWPVDTSMQVALHGFEPSPILALRTIKGGPVVGLGAGVAEGAAARSCDWNQTGDYGVIQLFIPS